MGDFIMIQEYLIKDNTEKEAIKAYKPDEIQVRIYTANKSDCSYIQFSMDRENEKTAKKLSDVDKYITEHFNVIRLEDGSSAYFNKQLYPHVSKFEYKLRKLLYLASAINNDEKFEQNIVGLESRNFGDIFSLLFIDGEFMNTIKENIKKRNKEDFSKEDILAFIESTTEKNIWEKLFGKNTAPILEKNFNDIRFKRNDVMHSHHIDWRMYRTIRKRYDDISSEVDKLIQNIDMSENGLINRITFNHILGEALWTQELRTRMEAVAQRFQNLYTLNPEWAVLQEKYDQIFDVFTNNSEMQRVQEKQKSWDVLKTNAFPIFGEMSASIKDMRSGMPKEMRDLYMRLSEMIHSSNNSDSDKKQNNDFEEDNTSDGDEEGIK